MTRFAGMFDVSPYLSSGDDWSKANAAEMDARSSNRITNIAAESQLSRSAIAGQAKGIAADYDAKAIAAGGQARASATMTDAISSGIGGIAKAGIGAYGRANNLGAYKSPSSMYENMNSVRTGFNAGITADAGLG